MKRNILFNADKLGLQIEVISTYIDISDKPSQIDSLPMRQASLNSKGEEEDEEEKLEN